MPYSFLRLEALMVFVTTMILYFSYGGTYLGLLLIVIPDIGLIGYIKNPKIGSIVYNLAHTYVAPAIFLLASIGLGKLWGVLFALLWLAHIGIDRTLGIGLKFPDSFNHTHLGKLTSNQFFVKRHANKK